MGKLLRSGYLRVRSKPIIGGCSGFGTCRLRDSKMSVHLTTAIPQDFTTPSVLVMLEQSESKLRRVVVYIGINGVTGQLRPHLTESAGSRLISKVKL